MNTLFPPRSLAVGLWLLALLSLYGSARAGTDPAQTPPTVAVIENGLVRQAVGATVLAGQPGLVIAVDGPAYRDVAAIEWNGADLTAALAGAIAQGSAAVTDTGIGFRIDWNNPPPELRDKTGQLRVLAAQGQVIASAAPMSCPARFVFGGATQPALAGTPSAATGAPPVAIPAGSTPAPTIPARATPSR